MSNFEPSANHLRLQRWLGRFQGHTLTWLDPGGQPCEGKCRGEFSLLFSGRFVEFNYTHTMEGVEELGRMTFGYDNSEGRFFLAWLDSFHTGTYQMLCPAEQDSPLTFLGHYRYGDTVWHWRTALEERENGLIIRMYNILPDQLESPATDIPVAVEFNLVRESE